MSLPINLNLIILWLSILIDRSHQLVYTHSFAKKLLTEAGIKFPEHECVFANCTWRGIEVHQSECNAFCALLEGIHDEVIDGPNGIITLANQSGCTITIVGGTDAKDNDEPMDKCTNLNGWRLNFLNNYCIESYIWQSFRINGDDTWIARSGNIYKHWRKWPDYWEVQYIDACDQSSPSENSYYDGPSANNTQTKLCENNGGSCKSSSRHMNIKWCNFYDGFCEKDEEHNYNIKCCVPKNSGGCVHKGGNCIFGHSCNLSNSLVIPNICPNSPPDVICCVPNEGTRTRVIAALTEQKSTSNVMDKRKWKAQDQSTISNLFANGVNLLFLLLLLLLIVVLIHKWYIKKKDNFTISSKWTDEENVTAADDDDETKMSLIPGRFYPENVTIAEHFIFQNSRIEIFDARGNFGNDSVIVKKKNEKATKGHQHQKNYHNSFAAEAAIHINLDHENVVKCFGCYAQNGRIIGILMEKMECNLSELFDKEKKSMNNAHMKALEKNPIDICIQLTEALVYLQSKRIVHADIADRNCLLKFGDNGKLLAKLSDFSLSKILEEGQKRASVRCIPQRWSPREIQKESGHFLVSFESDIWSLGATLIELFTHEKPYNLWKEFVIREEQKKNETTPLDYLEKMCMEKWQNIPPKARSIMEKCFITIEPSERITSERINATDLLNEWKNYENE